MSLGLDQVQGSFGPGPILGTGPSPAGMASKGLEGTSGGPGPEVKIGPSPNGGWTRSKYEVDQVQFPKGCRVTVPANTVFDEFCAWAAAEG